MHNQSDPEIAPAVGATGSPDPDDPRDPLDPVADPSVMDVDRAATVPDASEDSFPASDPPTWTSTASTPVDRERPEPSTDDTSPQSPS
jgi:hypothetical protein